MSAMTGICECFAISGSASASSWLGTATRTIWQPVAVSSAICCNVASMSVVFVVVIDWTDTGASPPTGTEPTMICRDRRLGASGGGGTAGVPNGTAVMNRLSLTYWVSRIGFTMSAPAMNTVSPIMRNTTAYVSG